MGNCFSEDNGDAAAAPAPVSPICNNCFQVCREITAGHHLQDELQPYFCSARQTSETPPTCVLCEYMWIIAERSQSLRFLFSIWPGLRLSVKPKIQAGLQSAQLHIQAMWRDMLFEGTDLIIKQFLGNRSSDSNPPPSGTATLSFFREKLSICLASHHHCTSFGSSQAISILPTRVIDVGPSDGSVQPRLIKSNKRSGTYVALSHCWGPRPHYTTTLKTLAKRLQGIPIHELPRTFADAVYITRHLGIRYLWIDSLCILQDTDKTDWLIEAPKMVDVYSKALVTIAAASSSDSRGGCFSPTGGLGGNNLDSARVGVINPNSQVVDGYSVHRVHSFEVRPGADYNEVLQQFSSSPLSQRGWVLQEMSLSPRVLFFGQNQACWMCSQSVASEDGVYDQPNTIIRRTNSIVPQLRGREESEAAITIGRGVATNLYELWYDLAEEYSKRDLTYNTDKLPALAGLVTTFSRACETPCRIGLWEYDLQNGLLWLPDSENPGSHIHGIPTWSWLSYDTGSKGPVMFPLRYVFVQPQNGFLGLQILGIEEQWTGTPWVSPISRAVVTAEGLVGTVECQIDLFNTSQGQFPWKTRSAKYQLRTSGLILFGGAVFDGAFTPGWRSLTFLEISRTATDSDVGLVARKYRNCLLIKQDGDFYCRIGCAWLLDGAEELQAATRTIISIV